MGLGGIIYIIQTNQAQEAATAPSPTAVIPIPPSPTLTSTPMPTHTPTLPPTPTSTSVVNNGGQEAYSPETDQSPTETTAVDADTTPAGTLTPPQTEEPEVAPTDTPVSPPTEEPEVASTDTPAVPSTEEPEITPTNTLVLQTPTDEAADTTPTAPAEMPAGGDVLPGQGNHFLIWAGLALLLLLLFGIINHLKSPSSM